MKGRRRLLLGSAAAVLAVAVAAVAVVLVTRASGSTGSPDPSGAPARPGGPTAVKVRPGDAVLTAAMVTALKHWQAHAGLPQSGALGPGDVVVLTQQVRVNAVTAQLGDDATAALVSVTST